MAEFYNAEQQLANTGFVRIFSYNNHNIAGTISFQRDSEERVFTDALGLINIFEEKLDDIQSPSKKSGKNIGDVLRSIKKNAPFISQRGGRDQELSDMFRKMNVIATFKITVVFRQFSSWQGNVFWREGRSEQQFRSVLELLQLVDGALLSVTGEETKRDDFESGENAYASE